MRIRILLSAGIAGMLTIASAGQAQNSSVADDTADTSDPGTTIVCRRYPPPTGSRIGVRRICRTEAEWNRADAENRQVVEREQRNRVSCPGRAAC